MKRGISHKVCGPRQYVSYIHIYIYIYINLLLLVVSFDVFEVSLHFSELWSKLMAHFDSHSGMSRLL